MANICSLFFEMQFGTARQAELFAESFIRKMKAAGEKHEGIHIGADSYLFDAVLEGPGEKIPVRKVSVSSAGQNGR